MKRHLNNFQFWQYPSGTGGVIKNPFWARKSNFSHINQVNWPWINTKTCLIGFEYQIQTVEASFNHFTFNGLYPGPGGVLAGSFKNLFWPKKLNFSLISQGKRHWLNGKICTNCFNNLNYFQFLMTHTTQHNTTYQGIGRVI